MSDSKTLPDPLLLDRFESALQYATQLHATQARKGGQIPYLSHLLAVTSLVLEAGGDEDQAIAALLHDAVEDQGGLPVLAEIRRRYGDRVGDIVEGCTDAHVQPKPPWKQRKQAYIDHLSHADEDMLLVSLADKVHNVRSILLDHRALMAREGSADALWERFKGKKTGTLWYYRELLKAFQARKTDRLIRLLNEFESMVRALHEEAGETFD